MVCPYISCCLVFHLLIVFSAVLDPCISYNGLKADFDNDSELDQFMESSKAELYNYYTTNYLAHASHAASLQPSTSASSLLQASSSTSVLGLRTSPQKIDFRSIYRKTAPINMNELDRYFELPQEDIDTCDPINWWYSRRKEYPTLYRLARNILAIPGKSVVHAHKPS